MTDDGNQADRNAWGFIFGLAVARLVAHGWTRDQLIQTAAEAHDAAATMQATGVPPAAVDSFETMARSMLPQPEPGQPGPSEPDHEPDEEDPPAT